VTRRGAGRSVADGSGQSGTADRCSAAASAETGTAKASAHTRLMRRLVADPLAADEDRQPPDDRRVHAPLDCSLLFRREITMEV
jgi:hypothetical protein